jgi:hypothetical protein
LKEASYEELRRIIREVEPAKPSTRISTLGQAATTVSANRKSEPKRLSQLFRRELDWIVMRALEKDRNRRYETASTFAADVQRYLNDEPVHACPPSVGYRLRKFASKYRLPVIVAMAFTLLLVAGVVASTWQALRAADAEHEAVRKRQEAEAAQRRATEAEHEAIRKRQEAEAAQYAANIGLVQAAWDNHNILRVRALLEDTARFPGRGFEWYHWQQLCRVEHLTLAGHRGGVLALAFAPDGQRLVTGVTDGTARIWDATNGQELLCLSGHQGQVTAVAYAPDGKWLVTGSTGGTARIWDTSSGRELQVLQGQNSGPIWAVAVTPDEKRVVTGGMDSTPRFWDVDSGQELLTPAHGRRQHGRFAQRPTGARIGSSGVRTLLGKSRAHGRDHGRRRDPRRQAGSHGRF